MAYVHYSHKPEAHWTVYAINRAGCFTISGPGTRFAKAVMNRAGDVKTLWLSLVSTNGLSL